MRKTGNIKKNIIPEQIKGKETGARAEKESLSISAAIALFNKACERLFDINHWDIFTGPGSAVFCLTDEKGNMLDQDPQVGNLIRIDIPGPGTIKGEGYDWVRIEAIEKQEDPDTDTQLCAFRVRPAAAPASDEHKSSHFYTTDATSTFIIQRTGKKVIAEEKGRNEVPNTGTDNILDGIRNGIVGWAAMNGVSFPQWKSLMEGMLK